jgi:hypothetical protein
MPLAASSASTVKIDWAVAGPRSRVTTVAVATAIESRVQRRAAVVL